MVLLIKVLWLFSQRSQVNLQIVSIYSNAGNPVRRKNKKKEKQGIFKADKEEFSLAKGNVKKYIPLGMEAVGNLISQSFLKISTREMSKKI